MGGYLAELVRQVADHVNDVKASGRYGPALPVKSVCCQERPTMGNYHAVG